MVVKYRPLAGITCGLNLCISPPRELLPPPLSLSVCPIPGGLSCHPETESLRAPTKTLFLGIYSHYRRGLWMLLFVQCFKKNELVARIFQKGEFTEKSEWCLFFKKLGDTAWQQSLSSFRRGPNTEVTHNPRLQLPHPCLLPGPPRPLNTGPQLGVSLPSVTRSGTAFMLLP